MNFIRSGIINAIISVILIIALRSLKSYNQLMQGLVYIQTIVLLLIIPLTKIALRKTFDKNGIKK